MKLTLSSVVTLGSAVGMVLGLGIGCGTDASVRESSAMNRPAKDRRSGSGTDSDAAPDIHPEMGVENEVGVYESADVESALADRMGEVRGCYRRAGRAQRYAGGTVTLRFAVNGDGTPVDVLVIGSDLGNYEVERCLVAVGRSVKFPAPNGHKATTFEYPVEFRSTHELQVQDLDESLKLEHDMAASMHLLAGCGPISETGASAIFYVEPSGAIGSVGLAATSTVNEDAAACTVREMRRWRMSATLPGRMLRYRASLPALIASAEPRRPAPLTVATRRRRR